LCCNYLKSCISYNHYQNAFDILSGMAYTFCSEWVTETWEARNPSGSCGGRFVIYADSFGGVSMANNLQKKPFLDYQAQIKYLKQNHLVINDEASATTALEKVSYYGLING